MTATSRMPSRLAWTAACSLDCEEGDAADDDKKRRTTGLLEHRLSAWRLQDVIDGRLHDAIEGRSKAARIVMVEQGWKKEKVRQILRGERMKMDGRQKCRFGTKPFGRLDLVARSTRGRSAWD